MTRFILAVLLGATVASVPLLLSPDVVHAQSGRTDSCKPGHWSPTCKP
jgi:hypothetical protein